MKSSSQSPYKVPQLDTNIRVTHKYRFSASNAQVAVPIEDTDLIGVMGGVCSVLNSTFTPMFNSVKVKCIEIWAPLASVGTPTSCAIEWTGTANSPNVEVSDTTVTATFPAYIKTRPPKNSLASFWQVASSTALCLITCPQGSIIDVTLSGIMNDNEANSTSIGITSGVVGKVYYLYLTGQTSAALVPIALTSTR